jgi:menaquinone-dependent protoporphyrinogen oxidase
MPHLLIPFATEEGQSRRIAEFAAGTARDHGWTATVVPVEGADAAAAAMPPDAVLLIASIHVGRHSAAAAECIRRSATLLDSVPSALLSVSLHAADPVTRGEAERYIEELLQQTGWEPTMTAPAAGALRYTGYSFLKRLIVRHIAGRNGLPTDTSCDHELTDWDEVRAFTREFLGRAPVRPEAAAG